MKSERIAELLQNVGDLNVACSQNHSISQEPTEAVISAICGVMRALLLREICATSWI